MMNLPDVPTGWTGYQSEIRRSQPAFAQKSFGAFALPFIPAVSCRVFFAKANKIEEDGSRRLPVWRGLKRAQDRIKCLTGYYGLVIFEYMFIYQMEYHESH